MRTTARYVWAALAALAAFLLVCLPSAAGHNEFSALSASPPLADSSSWMKQVCDNANRRATRLADLSIPGAEGRPKPCFEAFDRRI